MTSPGELWRQADRETGGHEVERGRRYAELMRHGGRGGGAMRLHGITIGLNDYPGTGADLAGCVNDARDWRQVLEARGGTVLELLDEVATGENIRTAIRSVMARARYRDTVVITYSGHGTWVPDQDGDEPDRRDEAWCPYDISTRGVIRDDELYQLLRSRPFGVRVIVISDSCYSGTVQRAADRLTHPRGRARFLPPAAWMGEAQIRQARRVEHVPARGLSRTAAVLLSGCADDEVAYDAWFSGRPNGAFTRAALDSLAQRPRNYRAWHRLIRAALPSDEYPQAPQLQASARQRYVWPVL